MKLLHVDARLFCLLLVITCSVSIGAQTASSSRAKPESVIDVTTESGLDASAKLNACGQAAQYAGGGICDARNLGPGVQTISATVSAGTVSAPVTFLFDQATVFVPTSSDVTLFTLVDGMSIEGTLTADVTGVPGWNGSVIASSGSIGREHMAALTHISRVICHGSGNTTGTCVQFRATSGQNVNYVQVGNVMVEGMQNGISLIANETVPGEYAWVNGNWFNDVMCITSQICFNLYANGSLTTTQVSQNHFTDAQPEMNGVSGLLSIKAVSVGNAAIDSNQWSNLTIFDASHGESTISFSSHTYENVLSGDLCFGPCNYGSSPTDEGSGNTFLDTKALGEIPTNIVILSPSATKLGHIAAGVNGPEIDLDAGNDLRIYQRNGGLQVFTGSGSDHNLYLWNLDPNSSAATKSNVPIQAPTGTFGGVTIGSKSTYFPIFNASGTRLGYLIYGASGVELDLDGQNTFRVGTPNGALQVLGGVGDDHRIYLQSLDSNPNATIVFNKPIAVSNGSRDRLACYKLVNGDTTLGYCETSPTAGGRCSCR